MKRFGKIVCIVGCLLIIPLIIAFGMDLSIFDNVPGKRSDWFSFWGGYLGAIIAVAGVYYQINSEKKNVRITESEISRPYFVVRYLNIDTSDNNIYFENKNELYQDTMERLEKTNQDYLMKTCISLQNISIHHAFSVEIRIDIGELKEFKIFDIKPFDECILCLNKKILMKDIRSIEITCLSELREKGQVTFVNVDNQFETDKSRNIFGQTSNLEIVKKTFKNYNPSASSETIIRK
ncbi:hypothetical protein [Latilactobacillus sakei]|uniref:hypothetical protein n=1 Tax=Latilactobacillus sakei TaxID=1599 RepID=UPI00097721DB|nr:hypothetical protein [Latilactobacillus sakei]